MADGPGCCGWLVWLLWLAGWPGCCGRLVGLLWQAGRVVVTPALGHCYHSVWLLCSLG